MSIKIMTAAWEVPLDRHSEKLVLLALADNANDEGVCWPKLATICRKTSLSERAVRDCFRTLERVHCLTVTHRDGRQNVYTVHPESYCAEVRPDADFDPDSGDSDPGKSCRGTPANGAGDPGSSCRTPRQDLPDTPAAAAGPLEPSMNHQGTVEGTGPAPTRPTGHPGFDAMRDWRQVTGLNVEAFERHIAHLAQLDLPKRLSPAAKVMRARELAATGEAEHQAALIDAHCKGDWRGLQPLSREQLAEKLGVNKQPSSARAAGKFDSAMEQLDNA